jgi:hypothetical protein
VILRQSSERSGGHHAALSKLGGSRYATAIRDGNLVFDFFRISHRAEICQPAIVFQERLPFLFG